MKEINNENPYEDIDYKLWLMLTQSRNLIAKVRTQELGEHGISGLQSFVMFIIQSLGDKATPTEISRIIVRKPHTVTGLLNRMEYKDLIKRHRHPDNRAMVRLELTEKGLKYYEKAKNRTSFHKIFSSLDYKEKTALLEQLKNLRSYAQKELGQKYDILLP